MFYQSELGNFIAKCVHCVGHLNTIFAPGGREVQQQKLQKFQCPVAEGLPGGMLMFRFDRYISKEKNSKLT